MYFRGRVVMKNKFILFIFIFTAIRLQANLKIVTNIKEYLQLPQEKQLVDIAKVNPNILLDLRYYTDNNFVEQQVYKKNMALARFSTAKKLDKAQKELEKMGLGLKIWDPYRPYRYQQVLYDKTKPDQKIYCANPKNGSSHNRGAAIDLTIVDKQGNEIEMPTEFDHFGKESHLNYMNLPPQKIINRTFLVNFMEKHGFTTFPNEWWHFNDKNYKSYDLLDLDFDKLEKYI
jgi:zinc D-Ala-D-Ala dipeptidase